MTIGSFAVLASQCRVRVRVRVKVNAGPSVTFYGIYLCYSWKYSTETKEKLTFSYRFPYFEKVYVHYPRFHVPHNCHAVLTSAELSFCLFSILCPYPLWKKQLPFLPTQHVLHLAINISNFYEKFHIYWRKHSNVL